MYFCCCKCKVICSFYCILCMDILKILRDGMVFNKFYLVSD